MVNPRERGSYPRDGVLILGRSLNPEPLVFKVDASVTKPSRRFADLEHGTRLSGVHLALWVRGWMLPVCVGQRLTNTLLQRYTPCYCCFLLTNVSSRCTLGTIVQRIFYLLLD